jgi:hypothetical protein
LCRVVSQKLIGVSEVRTASVIALMMDAVSICETMVNFHGAISQKAVIFDYTLLKKASPASS